MKLKFIGTDGSMGLKHGQVYDVYIYTKRGKIIVAWDPNHWCPYSSPQALAENWTKEE